MSCSFTEKYIWHMRAIIVSTLLSLVKMLRIKKPSLVNKKTDWEVFKGDIDDFLTPEQLVMEVENILSLFT